MPKRSAQDKLERYQRKIRKIEEKERQRRKIRRPLDSSDDETSPDDNIVRNESENVVQESPEPIQETPALDIHVDSSIHIDNVPTLVCGTSQDVASNPVDPQLDPELLSALGESTDDLPEFGAKIHDNLAKLWLHILKKGMTKECKELIVKQYLVPENCKMLQSPKLNAEISAAISDMTRNRDKKLASVQQQIGFGITAINRAMDLLLRSDNKVQAMKYLGDSCRILSDLHFVSTQDRIKLITPSLDKSFVHIIQGAERDDSLFGIGLSEKIKASKAIEKQGLQIKRLVPNQKASTSQATAPRPSYPSTQGNWTGPPRYPSNRGGRSSYSYRKAAPASAVRRPHTYTATQPRQMNQPRPRAPAQQ